MLLKVGGKSSPSTAPWALNKKLRFIVIALSVTGFLAFLLLPEPNTVETRLPDSTFNSTISSNVACDDLDFETLDRLGVSKLAQYTQREIIAVRSGSIDKLATKKRLDTPLLDTDWKPSNKTDQGGIQPSRDRCLNPVPIRVQVPVPSKRADASHIDFGVATTVTRLNDSLDAFSHWAGYSNTRIFALVEPDKRKAEVQAKADTLGINLFMTESNEEYNRRYFSLVEHLVKNARDKTRWSCIIDDDTFFPSMPALVQALGRYDDTKPVYLGGLSESIPQIAVFGVMAYGGAGVFLSRPLLDQLSTVYESCRSMDVTGDRKISYCIYQHTGTKLTVDHRLRQLDIQGDASGFFEAGRDLPLSVHHWKSWFDADMTKLSAVSEICGDSCLLGQWQFSDKWILTNGFSVVRYSTDVDPDDKTMERTWEDHNGASLESFLHELGPLRPKDGKKFSYRLEDAVVEDGQVRQWYVHRDASKGDQVLELLWRGG